MLTAYTTERTNIEEHILLDANEHYVQWVKMNPESLSNLNRYPDDQVMELRRRLATVYTAGLSHENVLVTSGSIEGIDVIIRALRPSSVIINTPGYDVYSRQASVYDVPSIAVPINADHSIDTDTILTHATQERSMVVLINPNNPTGQLVDRTSVRKLAEKTNGFVVIDEAYIEYAGLENSMESLLFEYQNIIILRTFSKAWGLAGLRLGYILSSREVVSQLALYKNPYSVSSVAVQGGISALEQVSELKHQVAATLFNKQVLFERLQQAGIPVTDTYANFLIIESVDTAALHGLLRGKGIIVRPRKLLGATKDCLRITVGSTQQNELFYDALMEAWNE